jgi:hypothetical protein
VKGDLVPDTDHITRYCGGVHVEDGKILSTAFMYKKDTETYLSVNWLEFLRLQSRAEEVAKVREILRRKLKKVRAKARIVVLNVGNTRKYVLNESPNEHELTVLHEPDEEYQDQSHAGIYGTDPTDSENAMISELIADTVLKVYPARNNE